jgi:hypothetical protein
VHKDPDYERRVQDYTAAFQGMDNDGDGTITFEVRSLTALKKVLFKFFTDADDQLINCINFFHQRVKAMDRG